MKITDTPETPEQWWALLEQHHSNIEMIIERYNVGKLSAFRNAVKERNWVVASSAMNTAWFNAHDNASIHSIPSWGVLCDLCSETWVFPRETT